MLRTLESDWLGRLRGSAGWLILAVVVTFFSYVTSLIIAGSPKLMLLILAGFSGLVMLMVLLPNPFLAPYIVFVVMPFSGWAYKESPGSGFNFLLDALAIVAFVAVVLNRKRYRFPQQLGVPIIFLLLIGLVQTLNPSSGGTDITAIYAIRENLLPMLMFFVGLYAFRSKRQVLVFLIVNQLVAVANATWAMKQVFIGLEGGEARAANPFSNPTWWIDGMLRAFSTLDSPWSYAYDTTIAVILGICLFIIARSWPLRVVALIGVTFAGIGLYLTLVRTSWLMVPLALLVIFLMQFRHPLRMPVIFAIGAAGTIMLMAMVSASLPTGYNPSSFGQIMSEFNILEDESMQIRMLNWGNQILPAILTYPLGRGLGTTGGVASTFNPTVSYTSDNTYLDMALQFGLMGLAVYVFMLFAALRLGFQLHAHVKDPFASWLVAGIVGIIVATVVADLTNTYANGPNGSLFYFLLGVMAAVGMMHLPTSQEPETRLSTPPTGHG